MENILHSHFVTARDNEFNPLFGLTIPVDMSPNYDQVSISLVELLQTTLEIDELLDIFSMEAAKVVHFCGLSLQILGHSYTVRGSTAGQHGICFNLSLNNTSLGQLSYNVNDSFSKSAVRRLEQLHKQLLYPLRNALAFLKIKKLALKDALTGLNNRGHFDDSLLQAMAHAKRNHGTFALMMLDLDEFKQVNDNYGHLEGDKVIQAVADILLQSVRGEDSVFRLGGDEYAVLILSNEINETSVVAARIQHNVAKHPLLTKYGVSTSIGFTFYKPDDSVSSLYSRSDSALYNAKDFGRNCTKTA